MIMQLIRYCSASNMFVDCNVPDCHWQLLFVISYINIMLWTVVSSLLCKYFIGMSDNK